MRLHTSFPLTAVFLMCAMVLLAVPARAASVAVVTPEGLPYSGVLTQGGVPVTGTVSVTFRLYTGRTGGSPIWQETQTDVNAENGRFTVLLGGPGSANPIDIPLLEEADGDLWLEVIYGGTVLTPRMQLNEVPYAMMAEVADAANIAETAVTVMTGGVDSLAIANGAVGAVDVDAAAVQLRVTGACPPGQVMTGVNQNGTVNCALDLDTNTDTTYSAAPGSGLTLSGTAFGTDTGVLQARVVDTCPTGQKMIGVTVTGKVICEADQDTDTTYAAALGSGLTLTGTEFGVDTAILQARVVDTCPEGQMMIGVSAAGNVICAVDQDTDTNTTYTAAVGSGLILTGTEFGTDPAVLQRTLQNACAPGQVIAGIDAFGNVTCADNTDTDTTYTAGNGLLLTGTEFSADEGVLQKRLTGNCALGQVVAGVQPNGTLICVDDADTNTTYSAALNGGLLLDGLSNQFSVDKAAIQIKVTGNCSGGQVMTGISPDGAAICVDNPDTDTTYTAGFGLSPSGLTGTTFDVNPTIIQERVWETCPAGQVMTGVKQDGGVICAVDADTPDTNTTYSAALNGGLLLGGVDNNEFSVDITTIQARVDGVCPADQVMVSVNADGTVNCVPDQVDTTTYSAAAGSGLTLTGTEFGTDTAILQKRLQNTCAPGQVIAGIDELGNVTCADNTDTTYTAGNGLLLTGTEFSADEGVLQKRLSGNCTTGQVVVGVEPNGTLICVDDTDTTYSATVGGGLLLDGLTNQFSVDTAAIQARVADTCPAGQKMTGVNADGTVVCTADDDTTYAAAPGSGLTLIGAEFGTDPAVLQRTLQNACAPGQVIAGIDALGNVTCADNTDTDTTYTAGTWLTLTGTTFDVDTGAVQARVTGFCAPGQVMTAVNADGSVTCAADLDTDTDTTYTAGLGLTLTGLDSTTFAINDAVVQLRVTGACLPGQVMTGVNADGTVNCVDDADTDTTYTAGTWLTLTGTTFDVDTGAVQARVTGFCAPGQVMTAVNADGSVTCAADADTDTTYTAGLGLILTGLDTTTFAVNDAVVQLRVAGTCTGGQVMTGVNADGTVNCVDDTDTTYTAGTGLTLLAGAFNIDPTYVQARVTGVCAGGQVMTGVNVDGSVTCVADQDTDTTYSAAPGGGLTLTGTAFSADTTVVQSRVTGTCPAGEVMTGVNADGSVVCAVDANTPDTDTTYTAGSGLNLVGTEFSVDATAIQSRVTGTCGPNQVMTGVNADGSVTCAPDNDTTYTAGTSLTLTGTTFDTDPAVVQDRVTGTCPAGQVIDQINQDGTVLCKADEDTTYLAGAGLALDGGTNTFSRAPGSVAVSGVAMMLADSAGTCRALREFNGRVSMGAGTDCETYAPVSLPDGATLTGLRCVATDTDAGRAVAVALQATFGNSSYPVFSTGLTGDIGVQTLSTAAVVTPGSDAVINGSVSYHLVADFTGDNSLGTPAYLNQCFVDYN